MKLAINRTEEQNKGFFKTTTVYNLHINLEVTQEEMALIKKHKWEKVILFEASGHQGRAIPIGVEHTVERKTPWGFDTAEELTYAEKQLIENVKNLKQQLEAAAGFTSTGSREIDL